MTNIFKKMVIAPMIASFVLAGSAALADTAPTPTLYTAPAPTAMRKTIDLPCTAAAVAKREAAVSSAFATKSSAISAAFTTRASALAAAWAITTAKDRNAAIKAAWMAFNSSAKSARSTYTKANRAAWAAFRTDAKACHASTSTDAGGSSIDNNL